jgi:L-alanine-DL-glutamate epimerase-like enolase superfamily enzyme
MDMKISSIDVIPLRVPLHTEFAINRANFTSFEKVILRLRTESGIVGYGEATVDPGIWAQTLEGMVTLIERTLVPPLLGKPLNPRVLHQIMEAAVLFPSVTNPATAAVDMAMYDALGKGLGVPVSTLLGGARRDRIPVVFSSIDVYNPADTAKAALEAVERGFPHLKIKGGVDPDEDILRMAAVKEAIGETTWIRLDVNEGYPTAEVAIRVLKAMENSGVRLVEDPIPRSDIYGLTKVVRESAIPVVVQQGLYGPLQAMTMVRYEAANVLNITVQPVGGLHPAAEILAVAESAGIPVFVGAAADLGIGTAASAHLASIIRHLNYPSDCRFQLRFVEDILTTPMRIENGYTYVPIGPGLGVEVDEARLDKYRVS